MASKQTRRSISFEILANNSPGDGDSIFAVDDKTENKARRRRKKTKSRKLSMGDLSPVSPFDEDLSSLPPSPASTVLGNRVPPLKGSLRALGVNSSLFASEWRNGNSPTDSSPSVSAYSPGPLSSTSRFASSRASSLGTYLQDEFRSMETSNETSVNQIEVSLSNTLDEKRLVSEDMQKAGLNSEDQSSQSTRESYKFYSDPKLPRSAASHGIVATVSSTGSLQTEAHGSTERSVTPKQQFPLDVPDFSAASEGLAEPGFAPSLLHPPAELRQRLVEKPSEKEGEKNCPAVANGERMQRSRTEFNPSTFADEKGTPPASKLRLGSFPTPQLKDWERLMASNVHYPPPLELSPMQYIVTEVCSGSTLRNTTSVGTDQKRERVYNTMFHVPWRCELLIDVGFFVCVDAFLSLFTIMPARIVMFIWQRLAGLVKGRQLQRLHAAELCDFGCLVVLVVGVAILMQADISIIYHWIRGQGVIKLYVVFNVLEIFDKLGQSFGADVLQVLFNSAVSVECCKSEYVSKEMARFAFDQCIAIVSFFVHSLVIISQAITISAAVNAQNNALLTLLISNNFAEIKSNVFKRMGTDQLHKMAYHDTVERFHIMTHVLFVWAQNVLNREGSLWPMFFYNAGMVYSCEVLVDVIKHSFLAKFNEVKPAAYSEFLQALCSQTLNSRSHEVHKTLTFVPLAPACVVMRILLPVYAACVPEGPIWWRWPCMLLQGGLTYITLVLFKVIVGLGLQIHAKWYLNRHPWTVPHPHFE